MAWIGPPHLSSLFQREGLRPAPTQSRQRAGGEGFGGLAHPPEAPQPNPLPPGEGTKLAGQKTYPLLTAHRYVAVCCLRPCGDRVTILQFWQPQVVAQCVGFVLGPK